MYDPAIFCVEVHISKDLHNIKDSTAIKIGSKNYWNKKMDLS